MLETTLSRNEGGPAPMSPTEELDTSVDALLNRWPAVGLAVGVVRDGRLDFFRGHGVADIAAEIPITGDTIFRIASITKTFTAIAVMQLWEQGLVDLDRPANDYLHAYRLVSSDSSRSPATVRQLITHTAGIPEVVRPWDAFKPDFGESVAVGEPLPTLADFYDGQLRVEAEPGTRFVYGNHGFATLGQIVEDVTGRRLADYFRSHIFEPLGMADTDLDRTERVKSSLATGYQMHSDGPRVVAEREMITAAAASIYSSPNDMARYVAALAGGGANEQGRVLKPETLRLMFEPHYQPDPRLPGMGLSYFRFDLGGHLAVEHGGVLPGFNSQIFVAPEDGIGVMAFTNGAKGAMLWMPAEMSRLLEGLLDVPERLIRSDIPHRPDIWGEICGWYQVSARLADTRLRLMMGAGAEVLIRGNQPVLRILSPIPTLYKGFPLHPDDESDPYVFRVDLSEFGVGSAGVLFRHDPSTRDTSLHLDLMPLGLHRRPSGTNPRVWGTAALAALAAAAVARMARGRSRR